MAFSSAIALNRALKEASLLDQGPLFEENKAAIPGLVRTAYELKLVLEHLTPEQREIVFTSIRSELPTMLLETQDLAFILPYLSREAGEEASAILEAHLSATMVDPLVAKKEELAGLIGQIGACCVGPDDHLIYGYINYMTTQVERTKDSGALLALETDLRRHLVSVGSDEVINVKRVIGTYRAEHSFLDGKNTKANNIEKALRDTPLLKRGTVISSEEPNAVKSMLGKGRFLGTATTQVSKLKAVAELDASFKDETDDDINKTPGSPFN